MSISMFGESSSNQCCSIQNSHVPQRHKFDFITASVNCAGSYSIATTEEGKCYVWGLVPWAMESFSAPFELHIPECVHAQAANNFALVITKNGSVLCIEKQTNVAALKSVADIFPKTNQETCKILCSAGLGGKFQSSFIFLPNQGHVVQISCGLEHAVILTASSKLFGWGSNQFGQLDPTSSSKEVWSTCRSITSPLDVDVDNDVESSVVTQISCRSWATAVLFQKGGFAVTGALSLYGLQDCVDWKFFSLVGEGASMGMIALGSTFLLASTLSGVLYSLGRGPMGELGQGDAINICTEPTLVAVMKGRIITSIACGDQHAAAICEDSGDSALFLWGRNLSGECAVHPGSGPITTPRLVSEFSSRSGVIPIAVKCGTNFTVVIHSGTYESSRNETCMQTSEEPFQTFGSEISSISAPTEWFKKPQTVEGFLDEQIQTSTLLEAATATIQSQTSASLRSNMFLGRSIESRDFIPFPEATDEGVLESQIAQSPYLTQDEKRWSLTQQNISLGSRLKLAQARSILISDISISGVEVRSNSSLLLKIRALSHDGREVFVIKAAPAPLNDTFCANLQGELKISLQDCNQITLQFRIKHKDFTGISMLMGECCKAFKFEEWFQSSFEGCQLLSLIEPVVLNLSIVSKSGSLVSKGYIKANFLALADA